MNSISAIKIVFFGNYMNKLSKPKIEINKKKRKIILEKFDFFSSFLKLRSGDKQIKAFNFFLIYQAVFWLSGGFG